MLSLSRRTLKWKGLRNSTLLGHGTRSFHATAAALGGRRTGSSALEPSPRGWSKSQMKRHAAKNEERKKSGDFGKRKMKEDAAMRKMQSPEMTEYMNKLQAELFPGIREMMLPDGSYLHKAEDDALLQTGVDPAAVMDDLRECIRRLESGASMQEITPVVAGSDEAKSMISVEGADAGVGVGVDIAGATAPFNRIIEEKAYIAVKLLGIDKDISGMENVLSLLSDLAVAQRKWISNNNSTANAAETSSLSPRSDSMDMTMEPLVIPITVRNEYLKALHDAQKYEKVQELFTKELVVQIAPNKMGAAADGVTAGSDAGAQEGFGDNSVQMVYRQQADMTTWSFYVQSMARSGKADEALAEINRLEAIPGLEVHTDMYNAILDVFVDDKRYPDALALWERMHVTPNLKLNNGSFVAMLKYCSMTNQCERAFYVYDELRALGLNPDAPVFAALFRACAEAPQFVNGYQDTVEEAMCLMEGCEIYPTAEVYENIIYAYSIPGDYVAAEFYFWEMKKKGLLPTPKTYENLLQAYARNSSVGLKSWGYNQRFVKKAEKLTEDQKVVRKIPPARLAKLMSEDVYTNEDDGGRHRMGEDVISAGGGRKKPIIFDEMGDNHEEFMQQLRDEAQNHPDLPEDDFLERNAKLLNSTNPSHSASFGSHGAANSGYKLPQNEDEEKDPLLALLGENSDGSGQDNEEISIEKLAAAMNIQLPPEELATLEESARSKVDSMSPRSKQKPSTVKSSSGKAETKRKETPESYSVRELEKERAAAATSGAGEEEDNFDLEALMKDPSAIDSMLNDFTEEEKSEFSAMLGKFGMSGDMNTIAKDLFSEHSSASGDGKASRQKVHTIPSGSATTTDKTTGRSKGRKVTRAGKSSKVRKSEAESAMMDASFEEKEEVEDHPTDAESKSDSQSVEELLQSMKQPPRAGEQKSSHPAEQSINFDGTDADKEDFDELMAQLSRIETQSEGKVSLDKLMQQFMMEEAAAAGAQVQDEPVPEIAMKTNDDDSSYTPKSHSHTSSAMDAKDEDVAEVASARRVPSEPIESIFAPPIPEIDENMTEEEREMRQQIDSLSQSAQMLTSILDGTASATGDGAATGGSTALSNVFTDGIEEGQQVYSQAAITSEWERIEFGRVQAADYTAIPVLQRRKQNVEKAEAIIQYMEDSDGIAPTVDVLNSLLSAYTEALMASGAKAVISELFQEKYAIQPNSVTYQHMIRMHLRKKDIDGALQEMDNMKQRGILPTPDSWGLVIDAFAARNKPVEALKIIEEVANTDPKTVQFIPEGYLKRIRTCCRQLAVEHPALPPDPDEWVRDVKLQRRRMKLVSKSRIQPLRSYLYT